MNRRAALGVGAATLLGACGFGRGGGGGAFPPEVTGTVTYRERFALPPDAELRVTLYETKGAGATSMKMTPLSCPISVAPPWVRVIRLWPV